MPHDLTERARGVRSTITATGHPCRRLGAPCSKHRCFLNFSPDVGICLYDKRRRHQVRKVQRFGSMMRAGGTTVVSWRHDNFARALRDVPYSSADRPGQTGRLEPVGCPPAVDGAPPYEPAHGGAQCRGDEDPLHGAAHGHAPGAPAAPTSAPSGPDPGGPAMSREPLPDVLHLWRLKPRHNKERWQKVSDTLRALDEFRIIVVVRGPG
jgi:hypothetical protein